MAGLRPRLHRLAVLGGTFDRLHMGHYALLNAAFRAAREVKIGVTTAGYLRDHPKAVGRAIRPYPRRSRSLERWVRREFPGRPFEIVPLRNTIGGALRPDADLLVVSAGTVSGAQSILRLRAARGLPPMDLIVVPLERGADGIPISSSRIRRGEVTAEGKRRTPLRIAIASVGQAVDTAAAERWLQERLPEVPLRIRSTVIRRARLDAGRTGQSRARAAREVASPLSEVRLGVAPGRSAARGWVAGSTVDGRSADSGRGELPLLAAWRGVLRQLFPRSHARTSGAPR
jgi:pantetheine-phosphate adenylyltransferase